MKTILKNARPLVLVLVAVYVAGCANGMPSKENMGYLYSPTVSACRTGAVGGGPNDSCVKSDLNRCKAMVDMANPGRDESTYMAITNTVSTIAGGAGGFALAGVGGSALVHTTEEIGGEVAGGGLGTILGYNSVLYRSSVEACMFSLGRDPKLTEQYFGMAAYWGGAKVVNFDATQRTLTVADH